MNHTHLLNNNQNSYNQRLKTMRNLLYLIGVILIIIWAVGFFAYQAGSIIHILPVVAITSVLKGFIQDKEPVYLKKNLTWKVQE